MNLKKIELSLLIAPPPRIGGRKGGGPEGPSPGPSPILGRGEFFPQEFGEKKGSSIIWLQIGF